MFDPVVTWARFNVGVTRWSEIPAGLCKGAGLHILGHARQFGLNYGGVVSTRGPSGSQLGLMLDREAAHRSDKRFANRLRNARMRFPNACIEDIDFAASRGLDRRQILSLAQGGWLKAHEQIILTGRTGTGKTWLACAFAHQAARMDQSVAYARMPRLFDDMATARLDGRCRVALKSGTRRVERRLLPLNMTFRRQLVGALPFFAVRSGQLRQEGEALFQTHEARQLLRTHRGQC
jgi:hypothetical protein